MLIKVGEKEKAHLLFIYSLGTPIFLTSLTSKRILGRNKIGLEIYSMAFGSQTSL